MLLHNNQADQKTLKIGCNHWNDPFNGRSFSIRTKHIGKVDKRRTSLLRKKPVACNGLTETTY